MSLLHVLFQRNSGKSRTGAQKIMSTSVPRRRIHDWAPVGNGCLGEPRECVEFAENRNHRLALSVARNECRRLVRHTGLNLEPCFLELAGQEGRTLLFVISEFCKSQIDLEVVANSALCCSTSCLISLCAGA